MPKDIEDKDCKELRMALESIDLAEISRLIKEGFTSGRLDDEDGKHICWELNTNARKDEKHTKKNLLKFFQSVTSEEKKMY